MLLGDKISFGSQQAEVWQFMDDSPPQSMLVPVGEGLEEIVLVGVHALPSEELPQVTLYMSDDGSWLCESDSGLVALNSGDCVGVAGKIWRFIDATPAVETRLVGDFVAEQKPVEYIFKVSQNEEHVAIKLRHGGRVIDMGLRQHHYLALMLARQRSQDRELGICEEEQGWVDKNNLSKNAGFE